MKTLGLSTDGSEAALSFAKKATWDLGSGEPRGSKYINNAYFGAQWI